MSVPMLNRSKILPRTVIIVIMTIKKTFMFFEMVVRKRGGAGDYLRHLLAVSRRHQHLTVV